MNDITVKWEESKLFLPRSISEIGLKINSGDLFIMRHESPNSLVTNWYAVGVIVEVPKNQESDIIAKLEIGYPDYEMTKTGYNIEFEQNPSSYVRMRDAINTFVTGGGCVSNQLKDILLGKIVNSNFKANFDQIVIESETAPNLPQVNESQADAIRSAIKSPFTLIQGPPGTGKTVTSASIVYHLAKRGQVLVSASSNVAVDHLAEKINKTGLRVVRLVAKNRESFDSSVKSLCLHVKAKPIYEEYLLNYHGNDTDEMNKLKKKAEQVVLNQAQVICCTCIGAGDLRILDRNFSSVLIDEATQATEPETLISLLKGSSQVIMVGDHKQLGPVVVDKSCCNANFDRSMFERLIEGGIKPIRLQIQYRMHPSISAFPSNKFYEGSMKNGVTVSERTCTKIRFIWPNPSVPMIFVSSFGFDECVAKGNSYFNRDEAVAVEKIVAKLLRFSVQPSQIGIITPYQGQRAKIVQTMNEKGEFSKK